MPSGEIDGVWINSEPDDEGRYHLYLELSADDVIPLSEDDAWGWVRECQEAMMVAEYDAAVLKQMTKVVNQSAAVELVRDLRADRPEFFTMKHLNFEMVPGVSASTGKPFIHLKRKGELVGQWERSDIDRHTLGVIGAIMNRRLDEQYRRHLEGNVQIDRGTAGAVVMDLINYRENA